MAESSLIGYKTMWEKEKLLVTSNFSFSSSVFKRLVQQTRKDKGLFGKGLTPLTDKPLWAYVLRSAKLLLEDLLYLYELKGAIKGLERTMNGLEWK